MSIVRPRVFTIPPGAPFLDTLADAVLSGALVPGWPDAADPLSLAEGTILLPTRRAARALALVLAEKAGAQALLLPRIVPLGDVEDAEETRLLDPGAFAGETAVDLPEASGTLRRLHLARLILDWARTVDRSLLRLEPEEQLLVSASPADALALAGELGALIDTLAIHGRTVDDIQALIPSEYSRFWEISHTFLQIAARSWPDYCEERGILDPALRRHRLLTAEAERLLRDRPSAPMIAAGSTGSMPATAALLAAIARLPRGAVVLPGLDTHLDERSFAGVTPDPTTGEAGHPGHPQSILARLLSALGVVRRDVEPLGTQPPRLALRERFLSEALRPAESTDQWRDRASRLSDAAVEEALDGVAVMEAADDREEACAIAVALRDAVREEARTAVLVTPDRTLAERVSSELMRWDIAVDDSAGQALDRSPAGALARLAAEAWSGAFEANALLALVAHPLFRLGLTPETLRRGRTALEIGVLRGPVLDPGIPALRAAVALAPQRCAERHAARPLRRLREVDFAALDALVSALADAFAGLPDPLRAGDHDLPTLVAAFEPVLESLARPGQPQQDGLFEGASGQALAALFDETRGAGPVGLSGSARDLPAFLHRLMAGRVVARHGATHPRIRVFGLLEARLMTADVVILAGLDEKTWPPESRTDAFLNRPMRLALGLPAPERRLGQTAHDLVEAMGAPRVILTRALKRGGDPTVASRFLQRMQAVAGPAAWRHVKAAGDVFLGWARRLDEGTPQRPARRPAPRPPLDRFPQSLSITEIDTLVRDPYAIYARHILGLEPLDPVAGAPDAALKGTLIHDVLGLFATEVRSHGLPADPLGRLLALGRTRFDATPGLAGRPEVEAFWWPRFQRIAAWMAGWEQARRAGGVAVEAEIDGSLDIPVKGLPRPFRLRGRADRIERTPAGGLRIVDFKTGVVPGVKEAVIGFAPQLTLEGAMAREGAFPAIPAGGRVEELLYVKLSGGKPPAFERRIVNDKAPDPDALSSAHFDKLVSMLTELASGERAFVSRPHAKFAKRYAPYDHLARVREWSLSGDADDGGDSGGDS